MCQFFSFCTEPENHGGKRFYFDWTYRQEHLRDENDSHSLICEKFGLNEDMCNKYEFNPLTKEFSVDRINSPVNDRIQAEDWVNRLDFKRVLNPLIIKPIIHPFKLPMVKEPTAEHIKLLKDWASVWASVRDSVGASVWASVRDSVGDSVWDSVWASIGDSVWAFVMASVMASIGDSVYGYISSFFRIPYKYDYSAITRLWERGIVASFDGQTWRLHSGKDAHVIYTMESEK